MKHFCSLLLILLTSFTLWAQDIPVKPLKTIPPYSKARMAMGFVFVSGQIGINPATNEMVKNDFRQEVRQVMNNIGTILKENSMSYNNIVKCTVYLTDMNNYGLMNEEYTSFFKGDFPAREAVQVVKLPMNANVEISAVAAP